MSIPIGEQLDGKIDELETKIEILMDYLGLEFTFNSWSDVPDGIEKARKQEEE